MSRSANRQGPDVTEDSRERFLPLYAVTFAFGTYFCMYAFRKPLTAAKFAGLHFGETQFDLKTVLAISQLLGYTVAKFWGIKFCTETTRAARLGRLISLIAIAELALLAFAVVPPKWKCVAIFFNGLPLGLVWGLVVVYLEGRRASDFLLAGLSCSFVVAGGVVKDVGKWLMDDWQVSELWMPFATGACFLLPFVVCAVMLDRVPDPSLRDRQLRCIRQPMRGSDRRRFLMDYAFGLGLLFLIYTLLTAFRDFRDIYAIEVLEELGYRDVPAVFTKTEVPIALGILVILAALNLVRSNRLGLIAAYGIMITGSVTMAASTWLLDNQHISGLAWMILVGFGAYMTYVPYNSVLFERLMATTRFIGTAAFAIYVADALGYSGSIVVQLFKDRFAGQTSRLDFLRSFSYVMSAVGAAGLAMSCLYFAARHAREVADLESKSPPS